jgi:hypothetical protein
MSELETKIIAWRARLFTAMPDQPERVHELETHLRDHIEIQIRLGMSASAALEEALNRIGEPQAIAREFGRLERRWFGMWRPAAVVYGLVAAWCLLLAVNSLLVVLSVFFTDQDWGFWVPGRPLRLLGYAALDFASVALVGAGILSGCILVSGWRSRMTEDQRRSRSRDMFRLLLLGGLLFPIGAAEEVWSLRTLLAGDTTPWAWPWPICMAAFTIFTWLQLAQFRRFTDHRMHAVFALIGVVVLALGWLAIVAGYGWSVVALGRMGRLHIVSSFGLGVVCQMAILFLHWSSQRRSTDPVYE